MANDNRERLLVLGVGNILLKDEGVGVRAAEYIRRRFELPELVSCIDGGTAGPALISTLAGFDHTIIIDAVRNGGPPGAIYRISVEQLTTSPVVMATVHQIGIRDVLALVALERDGHCPDTVIVGVEPQEVAPGMDLSPVVLDAIPRVADMVIEELARFGAEVRERPEPV